MTVEVGPVITARRVLAAAVRTWPRRVALALVALALVVVTAVGGFATVPEEDPDEIAVGEVVDLGPYTVAARSFFVSGRVWGSSVPDGADAWIGVVVDVESSQRTGQWLVDDSWRIVGDVGLLEQTSRLEILMSDGSNLYDLEPDVPQRVALLFPVADAAVVGDELTVRLTSMYLGRSFLFDEPAWYPDEVVGQVRLPRDDDVPRVLLDDVEEGV